MIWQENMLTIAVVGCTSFAPVGKVHMALIAVFEASQLVQNLDVQQYLRVITICVPVLTIGVQADVEVIAVVVAAVAGVLLIVVAAVVALVRI